MKSEALFRLIHSLSDREKRLYRRQAGQNLRQGRSHYLDLFNAIEAMPSFDHGQLLARLENPDLIKQLPTHLSRLFLQVTDFLRAVNEFPSVDVQLNAGCERVSILYERGLYSSARKELKKTQKLAKEHDNYTQLLRLADLERLFFFKENPGSLESLMETRKYRDRDFLMALQQQVELKLQHFDMVFFAKTRISQDLEQVQAILERLCGPSALKTIREAQASATDLILLDAIGLGAQIMGDFDRAYLAYSRMDSLWVSNPQSVAENATLYISFIVNFLHACLMKGRHDEFRNLLANLKTVHFLNELHALMLHEALLYLELLFCLNRFEYDRGVLLGPEIESMLAKQGSRITGSRKMAFYFNLGSLHFLKGEYSKANRWLAKLLILEDRDVRQDIRAFIPYFQLVLFIAMEDRDLLGSRLRARTRGGDASKKQPLELAITMLAEQFLRQPRAEFQANIDQFRLALLEILGSGKTVVGAGECLFWAEGKLKGKLPGEVLREYSQSYNQG